MNLTPYSDMAEKVDLSEKQRKYLIQMKSVIHTLYSMTKKQQYKDETVFLQRIIRNGFYHKKSSTKLNSLVAGYKYFVREL